MNDTRDALADLVSLSATWQSWTGAADVAAAKARVHQVSVLPATVAGEPVFTRPLAWLPQVSEVNFGRGGYSNARFELVFEADVAANTADKAALDDFEAKCTAVVREMIVASEGSGRLMVRSIQQTDPAGRSRRERDPFLQVVYTVLAGLDELP